MMNIVESLFDLQSLQLQSGPDKRKRAGTMEAIRKGIPGPVLTRYDRLVAQGKKGVAIVRHGVCMECHIRVAIGALADLAHESDIQVCGNCGRYLFLPANEPVIPAAPELSATSARRKKESLARAG